MSDPLDDEAFEGFLRQFEPRAPSPLPAHRRLRAWWALAAAVLAVIGLYLGLQGGWPRASVQEARRDTTRPSVARPRPTLGELSVILRPRDYPAVMADLQSNVLDDPRRSGGALRALAER